jgi:hypothetical protein
VSEDITVNIGGGCPAGFFSTFKDPAGNLVTLSVLCDLPPGHDGDHLAPDGSTWVDDDPG